jgi:uncharacterized protein YaiL (DUF2058 family)
MADSLRDQLLKSGLVQKLKSEAKPPRPAVAARPKPAQKSTQQRQHPQHPPRPQQQRPAKSAHEVDLASAYAQRAKREREEREQAQREVERVARERRERKQKLSALLEGKGLNSNDADVPRHFPHGNKIRRIYCTKEQLEKLNHGDLAIVQLAGRYLLVTREIALEAQTIQPESLVLLCDPNAPPEDDVPADLMW